jgi:bifunctional non-homologous end joining protein LigD
MPLLRVGEPFDHPDWIFELKHDGFRALAFVDGHHCTLVSRRNHEYKQFPMLQTELAHAALDLAVDQGLLYTKPASRAKGLPKLQKGTVKAL